MSFIFGINNNPNPGAFLLFIITRFTSERDMDGILFPSAVSFGEYNLISGSLL